MMRLLKIPIRLLHKYFKWVDAKSFESGINSHRWGYRNWTYVKPKKCNCWWCR